METRNVLILNEKEKLKKGKYMMLESYCSDPKCDCRRVYINVIYNNDKPLATIGYGWESLSYYEKFTRNDKEMAKHFKGPVLEVSEFNGRYADAILKLFKETMMKDQTFMNRLKIHYKLFKDALKKDEKKRFSENKILKRAMMLESNKEYTKAVNVVSNIMGNNPDSYHGLFLMARLSRKRGLFNLKALESAYIEAKKQNASEDVFELFDNEIKLSNIDKTEFMERINKFL